jgi:hypothetical protein
VEIFQGAHRSAICTQDFNLPYIYDYITKLCRQQAEVYKIMKMNMFAVWDKMKPDIENIRGLNLAMVKIKTVQVNKLPLWHKIHKIGMICSVKPVLIEDLCVVQKEEFSVACCMYEMYI